MRNKNAVLISALVCTACLGIGAVTVPNVSDSLTSVVQADDAVYEGFLYSVSGGEATITGYSEDLDMSNIVIPDVIKDASGEIPVTAIGENAFSKSKAVRITVGNNVEVIGNYAFAYCTALKELNLGSNTVSLGDYAIASKWGETPAKLTKLTIPDNLSVIGENIYGDSSSYYTEVYEIAVPASVKYIDSTFYHRATVKNITVDENNETYSSDSGVLYSKDKTTLIRCPQSTAMKMYDVDSAVKEISNSAFYSCTNLQIINVNDGAETVGNYAFAYCTGLKELNLGKNVTTVGDFALASKWGETPAKLTKLTIPDNLSVIGEDFYGDSSSYYTEVYEIAVPATAEYIDSTFYHRATVKNITVDENNEIYSSDSGVLYSKDKTTLIRCPQSTAMKMYSVDSAVENISNSAFYSCTNLQILNVNDKAETVGNYAFAYCTGLKELNLGKNVTTVGDYALASKWGETPAKLTKLTIPDNLSVIGEDFYGDSSSYYTEVYEIAVPATAEYIDSTFYHRATVKNITVDENNETYSSDSGVLYSKDKTTLIRCPQSTAMKMYSVDSAVKEISNSAFYSCKNLQVLNVNDGAETVGNYAFAYCTGLKELNLGKNVTTVGDYVLASKWGETTTKLTKLTIPDNLSVIGENFYGESSSYYTEVYELAIPESAEYVDAVFYNRASLKTITAGENNKKYFSLGGALYDAVKSLLVKFPQSSDVLIYDIATGIKSVEDSAFINTKVQSVLIPSTVTEIGDDAFKGSALKTVRGVKGSFAETFAAEKGYTFEEIAGDPETGVPSVSPSAVPSVKPSEEPSVKPSEEPSAEPSETPSSAPSEIPSAAPADDRGDVDGDGEVTTTDVRKILQYLVKTLDLSEEQQTAADVNNDGFVNSTDALLLLRRVAGVVTAE